jgi:hypothetical protein
MAQAISALNLAETRRIIDVRTRRTPRRACGPVRATCRARACGRVRFAPRAARVLACAKGPLSHPNAANNANSARLRGAILTGAAKRWRAP